MSWNERAEPYTLETHLEGGTSRHALPGGVLFDCLDRDATWFAARALRRTGGPDFDPSYEAATSWHRWNALECPHSYNLTLGENSEFQLVKIRIYWNGKTAAQREEAIQVVPVASRY